MGIRVELEKRLMEATARAEAAAARCEALLAKLEYVAMMTDVEIDEEGEENAQ